KQTSEVALSGWSMTITPLPTGAVPQTNPQRTGSTGCVTWTELPPASYMVTETPPSSGPAWFNTDPGPLCLMGAVSDVGRPTCQSSPSKTGAVTEGGQTIVSFGNLQSAEKHGQKFYDANADGTNNDGQGVNGWKITLTGTDLFGAITPINKSTDASGNY